MSYDNDHAANLLFGGTTPNTLAPATQGDSLLASGQAATPNQKPPADSAGTDPNDDHAVAGMLYEAQTTYRESLPDRLVDEYAVLDPAQREAVLGEIAEYRELAGELQVGNAHVEELVGMQEAFDQVTHEQADAWRAESEQTLVREFGGAQASELLADARLLVSQNPRLRAFLDEGARGNHPRVVRMVIDLARREKVAGRLKGGTR